MKRIVTVILATFLLSTGTATAAERKTAQEQPVAAATAALPKKLDLNRVSREELVGIPGIGPRMAQAIVELRSKKGSFKSVEELLEVTGIKEKKLAAIAGYLDGRAAPDVDSAGASTAGSIVSPGRGRVSRPVRSSAVTPSREARDCSSLSPVVSASAGIDDEENRSALRAKRLSPASLAKPPAL